MPPPTRTDPNPATADRTGEGVDHERRPATPGAPTEIVRRPLSSRTPSEREDLAEWIAVRLDGPVTVAGVLLVLILVADGFTAPDASWRWVWDVLAWALWALFVAEFVARLVVAPSTGRFLARNWWQLGFLLVPFLRFLRALTRSARVMRAVTASVRETRSAGRVLGGRVATLAAVTVGVVLAASEVLYQYGPGVSYGEALHDAAFATVSGEPFGLEGTVAAVLELVLALYATVLFAALAGALGAFFLDERRPR